MRNSIDVKINGRVLAVEDGCTVAVAIAIAETACRTSVSGERRGPLCAMGICFECRATVDGVSHVRTCQLLCEAEMDISTS
jgi:hypothetical protein